MTQHIVFLDRNTLIVNMRKPSFAHRWQDFEQTQPEQVLAHLKDATIAITNKVKLSGEILAQTPQLKMIAAAATGTDNIDLAYCRAHGIVVSNIRNYAVHTLPEHVFMLMLALRRNLLAWRQDVQAGLWQQADQFCLFTQPINDLYGSTLGIIGYGGLGKAVRTLAEAFGMRVLVAEHKGASSVREGYTDFDTVMAQSDVITLHSPLNEATRHMISTREFDLMKRSAILINTARGNLVDEAALETALVSGRIAGAGFDVLGVEPPREGNRLLDLKLPNFILTPHVAWGSRQAMQILADQLVDNIEAFVAGQPRNVV
ncbi:MAG: glycerate dehydrogenase [Betaproteobacteria bacterium RBG_16_58_11]|nr:MAG: glycerate dehydrogenase [Betaproteobacteria bacterium RBG_16_58_11]